MPGPIPNVVVLPYGRVSPLHIKAPNWRDMLKLMARLSNTRLEPTVEAMAVVKATMHLRVVINFVRVRDPQIYDIQKIWKNIFARFTGASVLKRLARRTLHDNRPSNTGRSSLQDTERKRSGATTVLVHALTDARVPAREPRRADVKVVQRTVDATEPVPRAAGDVPGPRDVPHERARGLARGGGRPYEWVRSARQVRRRVLSEREDRGRRA